MKRLLLYSRSQWLALSLASLIWLPQVHHLFASSEDCRTLGDKMLKYYVAPEADISRSKALVAMRAGNPEWDFMGRMYLVLALANHCLELDPALRDQRGRYLKVMDQLIDDTLALEAAHGQKYFLMTYADGRPFVVQPWRSQFVDGEIALMLAARILISPHLGYEDQLKSRVALMADRMRDNPFFSAESYPDECWLFCNSVALAAIRIADVITGSDHRDLLEGWVSQVKNFLTEPTTGLPIATYTLDGKAHPAGNTPEGTSLYMACDLLQVVDAAWARDMYERSRACLKGTFLGFGFSREWPRGLEGSMDIDSGPVVPILGASVAAGGMAMIGACAFDDAEFRTDLMRSLFAFGFPEEQDGGLRFRAGNLVGDAVLMYAFFCGPLWAEVARRSHD